MAGIVDNLRGQLDGSEIYPMSGLCQPDVFASWSGFSVVGHDCVQHVEATKNVARYCNP